MERNGRILDGFLLIRHENKTTNGKRTQAKMYLACVFRVFSIFVTEEIFIVPLRAYRGK